MQLNAETKHVLNDEMIDDDSNTVSILSISVNSTLHGTIRNEWLSYTTSTDFDLRAYWRFYYLVEQVCKVLLE